MSDAVTHKPTRRRLATDAALASLALLFFFVILWIHSGYASDAVWGSFGGPSEYHLRSDWGRITLTRVHQPGGDDLRALFGGESRRQGGWYGAGWGRANRWRSFYGIIDYVAGTVTADGSLTPVRTNPAARPATPATYWRITAYHPVLLPLLLLPAVPWLRQAVRAHVARRRSMAGRCAACGYDLRGSADRCPECGKQPSAAAAAA